LTLYREAETRQGEDHLQGLQAQQVQVEDLNPPKESLQMLKLNHLLMFKILQQQLGE
jgi:hypothetical protein